MSDIALKNTTDLAPAFLKTGGATGFEQIDNDCISIPFLRLAQVNTPQIADPEKKIKGLSPSEYFNPTTGRIYGATPNFTILGFFRSWNVWFGEPPKAKFVKSMTTDDFERNARPIVKEVTDSKGKKSLQDSSGNRYQDTRNFFVLSVDYPEDGVLLYPMTSTGIPASKKWLAKASAIRVDGPNGIKVIAPMWARVWTPKVTYEKNESGNFYQATDFEDKGWISAALAPTAKAAFEECLAYDKSRVAATEHKADLGEFNGQF